MSAFWAIVRKELRSVSREKTIMIAIGIQLFVASFSSAILIGLLSFYDPDSISVNFKANVRVGLMGDANSPLKGFLQERGIRVVNYTSSDSAQRAFELGFVDAVVFVPQDTGSVVEMKLILPQAEARSALILIMLKEPLKRFENTLRTGRGVELKYTNLAGLPSTTFEFLYSVIVPVLMFFPAFVAGSMAIDSIAEELENSTLETLRSAPIALNAIFASKVFAAWLLALMQCAAWVLLLKLNGIELQAAGLVLLLALLAAAINAAGSAFVALVFKDRERSQFVYSIVILIVISASSLFNFSPIALMTRLAAGDAYASLRDVAVYGILLIGMLAVFFRATRRLAVN